MNSKHRTSNDQRSIDLNPNNPAYKAAQDNRSIQMNPPPSEPPPATGAKGTATTKR